jgi:hypothetical protein
MFIALIMALAPMGQLTDSRPPDFFSAQERWRCTFKWEDWEDGEEPVVEYLGVYRSHVAGNFFVDQSIAQNDESALVFVFSDIGNTDVAGMTRRWSQISMIEKRTGAFKRVNVDLAGASQEAVGSCARY